MATIHQEKIPKFRGSSPFRLCFYHKIKNTSILINRLFIAAGLQRNQLWQFQGYSVLCQTPGKTLRHMSHGRDHAAAFSILEHQLIPKELEIDKLLPGGTAAFDLFYLLYEPFMCRPVFLILLIHFLTVRKIPAHLPSQLNMDRPRRAIPPGNGVEYHAAGILRRMETGIQSAQGTPSRQLWQSFPDSMTS